MNLYQVQDEDRPMYVVAESWEAAFDAWCEVVERENNMGSEDVVMPKGIVYVCDEHDLLLPPTV